MTLIFDAENAHFDHFFDADFLIVFDAENADGRRIFG
jgi:hypothetical protein